MRRATSWSVREYSIFCNIFELAADQAGLSVKEMVFLGFFHRNADPSEESRGCFGERHVCSRPSRPSDDALMALFLGCRQKLLGQALLVSCFCTQAVGRFDLDREYVVEAFGKNWHFQTFMCAENSGLWDFRGADSLCVASDCIPRPRFEVVTDSGRSCAVGYLTVALPLRTRQIHIVDHEPLVYRPARIEQSQFAMSCLERAATNLKGCGVKPLFVEGRVV